MRLDEIIRIDARDVGVAQIRQNIRICLNVKRKPFCQLGEVVVSMGEEGREQFFLFAQDNTAYGAAILNRQTLGGENGFYVTEIGLLEKLRYQGTGFDFYLALLDRGYILFSGGTQTTDGERVWRKLLCQPGISVRTIRLDDDGDADAIGDAWTEPDLRLIARKAG